MPHIHVCHHITLSYTTQHKCHIFICGQMRPRVFLVHTEYCVTANNSQMNVCVCGSSNCSAIIRVMCGHKNGDREEALARTSSRRTTNKMKYWKSLTHEEMMECSSLAQHQAQGGHHIIILILLFWLLIRLLEIDVDVPFNHTLLSAFFTPSAQLLLSFIYLSIYVVNI